MTVSSGLDTNGGSLASPEHVRSTRDSSILLLQKSSPTCFSISVGFARVVHCTVCKKLRMLLRTQNEFNGRGKFEVTCEPNNAYYPADFSSWPTCQGFYLHQNFFCNPTLIQVIKHILVNQWASSIFCIFMFTHFKMFCTKTPR